LPLSQPVEPEGARITILAPICSFVMPTTLNWCRLQTRCAATIRNSPSAIARFLRHFAARLKSRGARRLYLFGADSIKSLLFQRLKKGQTIRFSDSLDASYFEQLCSERLITKMLRPSGGSNASPASGLSAWIAS
jgi:hypothetical protein